MMTAKLFENGRSQAVRLPKEYRFQGEEVAINKIGDVVLLMPKENKWAGFLSGLNLFSDDFMEEGRGQSEMQERGTLRNTCWTQISVCTRLKTNQKQ